jgi:hypothetical protein
MTSTSLSLSTSGLSRVPIRESADDFEFIVGDVHHRCPSWVADFLSHRIAAVHAIDDTVLSYTVETVDRDGHFGGFLALGRGAPLVLKESDRDFYMSISAELCNDELYRALSDVIEGGISVENVVRRVKSLVAMEANVQAEIEFIASHFTEISSSEICDLDYEIMNEIVHHGKLRIGSEDSLYETIEERISSDARYFGLFDVIHFEFLSSVAFSRYFELVSRSFEHFTVSHWQSLWPLFCVVLKAVALPYEESSPFLGIIAYLTAKFGGNVHDRGVVNITAYVDQGGTIGPKNVADLSSDSIYNSGGVPNQWICFDFKTMQVAPTHYTVRSYSAGPNGWHLKNWVIEGSQDGNSWTEIDRRENNADLNSSHAVKTFAISKRGSFRMLRLFLIGPAHNGGHGMIISRVEFFGTLSLLSH